MGVPSTTATGGVVGLSVAAGAAACCPLPQAASSRVIAATVDTRVHCVLKNWVIWILYTRKKGGYGRHGRRARGPQFSLYRAISPIFVNSTEGYRREPAGATPRSTRRGCRFSTGRRRLRTPAGDAPAGMRRGTPRPRLLCGNDCGLPQ